MKVINSLQNETIKNFIKLQDKKTRNQKKTFIVEGFHLVKEAYNHHMLEAVLATSETSFQDYQDITCYLVTETIIKKLSTTINPQMIIGIVRMHTLNMPSLDSERLSILLLDNINDPGNLGSIVRTAAALGYDGIYMSKDCVDIYNDKALRATQGSIFKIPFFYTDLGEVINNLKEHEIICYGTSLQQAINLENVKPVKRFAVCFGNEANGIKDEYLNMMNQNLKITMKNKVESLNVLAASSIVMYELKK